MTHTKKIQINQEEDFTEEDNHRKCSKEKFNKTIFQENFRGDDNIVEKFREIIYFLKAAVYSHRT